jgi:hypothetical protein
MVSVSSQSMKSTTKENDCSLYTAHKDDQVQSKTKNDDTEEGPIASANDNDEFSTQSKFQTCDTHVTHACIRNVFSFLQHEIKV